MGEHSQANNDTQSTKPQRWCVTDCHHDGKSKNKANKKLDMLRCCVCMNWFHKECISELGPFEDVWNCGKCRTVPSVIFELLNELKQLRSDIKELKKDHDDVKGTLTVVSNTCTSLKEENNTLKQQVGSLIQDLQSKQWSCFHDTDRPSLVLGDSHVKDIDETKLKNTKVVSVTGGKVADVLSHLKDADDMYSNIVVCVGTNDCGADNFVADQVVDSFKAVIDVAKTRVSDPKQISISIIPPRIDSEKTQEHVDTLNACLYSVAEDKHVSYINNDLTFKLSDKSPNDGYLQADGVNLTHKGINRLAKNLKLKSASNCKNGNVVRINPPKRSSPPQKRPDYNQHNEVDANDGWTVARNRRRSHYKNTPQQSRDVNTNQRTNSERRCWLCGETNHVSHSCRHGQKITCHKCYGLGHKAKHCDH